MDSGSRRELGAAWVGSSNERPPEELDAAIIFAPVGALVPAAPGWAVAKGRGRVRRHPCHDRHTHLPVRDLVGRARRALGRQLDPQWDGEMFLALAPGVPVRTEVTSFPLERANEAPHRAAPGDPAPPCW